MKSDKDNDDIVIYDLIVFDGGITDENLEARIFNFVDAAGRFYTFINQHVDSAENK